MVASAEFSKARALHKQGRLADAAALYREVLSAQPDNADALHYLGLVVATLGDGQQALRLLGEAARLQPGNAALHANLGSVLTQAGRHAEAVACYERALALQPGLMAAHRGRGTALMHLGQPEPAIASFREAVRLAPNDDQAHNGLGVALERTGRVAEARACFQRTLALNPRNVEGHHNLGILESEAGRHEEALASLERALALQPNNGALHGNRGMQLLALGRDEEALASLEQALTLAPEDPRLHHNRGLALVRLGRMADARVSFERALAVDPAAAVTHLWRGKTCLELGQPEEGLASIERARELAPGEFNAYFDRGVALTRLDRLEEALASFDAALSADPRSHEAANNRGAVLVRLFRPADALADFAHAAALKPDYAEPHTNAGIALRGLGQYPEALASLDRALALRPGDPTATWCKALIKLALGELREGWPLYETRLQLESGRRLLRNLSQSRWTGREPIEGRTLLVQAEQGLGDTLQFCRYIPRLEELGAQVVFEVQPVLKRLLGSLGMRGTLIARGEPLPQFDYHSPLGSLPLALGTELESIPGGVPYLHVDAAAVEHWSNRLQQLPGLRVGINWQGNPEAEKLAALEARSFPLAAAAPLARLEGVSLVSLQKGTGAEQRTQVDWSGAIAQLTDPYYLGADEIAGETGPILKGLDLLITADTALAHLAGALGVRVWVVLQAVPDWRWLIDRDDSPWYPTMRLFRQRTSGDWPEVFNRVAAEVSAMAGRRS